MAWLDSVSVGPKTKNLSMSFDNECVRVTPFVLIVIGRGGEQISRLQQESGCKIQIASGMFRSVADILAPVILRKL